MTATNHALTGAVIALVVRQPALAIPLAFVSHFALDALPHYGHEGNGYSDAFKYKLTFVNEFINVIGVPLLIYLLWHQSIWVWLAAFAAVSPDLAWVYRYFRFERKGLQPPGSRLTRFHQSIQDLESSRGVFIEYAYFIIFSILLWHATKGSA